MSTVSLIASVISPVAIGDSSLNGQHLNVYWVYVIFELYKIPLTILLRLISNFTAIVKLKSRKGGVFNESFYGSKKGGVMIEYLAKRFNFT